MRAMELKVAVAGMLAWCGSAGWGQASAGGSCAAGGHRVVASYWDAVMGRGWELVGDCGHPEWPARLVATLRPGMASSVMKVEGPVPVKEPLMVHAGETVRLWMQADRVRIEMSGVAEQSAYNGGPVVVRVTHPIGDGGVRVERFSGTVRGIGDVEMEAAR